MTVPAAEKITTDMIRTTPVLMELSVCQVLRQAERSGEAMCFAFPQYSAGVMHVLRQDREEAQPIYNQSIEGRYEWSRILRVSHNTHLFLDLLRFHPAARTM